MLIKRFDAIIRICRMLPFILLCNVANSQGVLRTDLISPSPTAADLGKYGDMPLTYYTGLPAVSIPIFDVRGNELNVPIKLTYNFNGHRPAQKAGWVGLGWSLQAGGVITRTIGDKVEVSGAGYNRETASQVEPPQTYLEESYSSVTYDNKPDIYRFNFGEYSGKFIMYKDTGYAMPYEKMIIAGGGGSFNIITDDGTRYEFNEMEQSNSKPIAEAPYTLPTHGSAWYLTRITNAAGTESIRLTYVDDGVLLRFGPQTQSYNKLLTSTRGTNPSSSVPGPVNQLFPTRIFSKRLSSIVSDKYSVTFGPGEVRADLEVEGGSSRSLGSITVSSSEGDIIKRLDFEYGYFGNGASPHMKYLKLKSLIDRGAAGPTFMKHTFDYYNESGSFGSGISTSVDKYGFMKDATLATGYISNEIYPWGVDRSPSFSAVVSGALKTITYPTGGSTTFHYEQNVMFDGQNYEVDGRYASEMAYRSDASTTNTITKDTPPFEITQEQQVSINFSRTDKVPYEPGVSPVEVDHDNVQEVEVRRFYYIYDESDGHIVGSNIGSAVYTGKIVLNADNAGKTETFSISPGRYVVRVICDPGELNVSGTLSYKYYSDVPIVGKQGPGIRLNEMINNDGSGNVTKKRYRYVDEEGFSTGILLRSDEYDVKPFERNYYTVFEPLNSVGRDTYLSYTSALSESQRVGLPFYYKGVIEEAFSEEEVHRTKYVFSYFSGTQSVELENKIEYSQTNDTFVERRREAHTFSAEVADISFAAIDVFIDLTYIYDPDPRIYDNHYGFSHDVYSVYWKYPKATRQVQSEGDAELVIDTQQFYDERRNMIGKRVSMSDGGSIYTKYKYPEDYFGVPSVKALRSANMLSSVIEEQTWRKKPSGDSVMTGGRINVYSGLRISEIYVFESALGIANLNSEFKNIQGIYTSLISDTRYKRKIRFEYDESGRLICQLPADKAPISYLWGYHGLSESTSPESVKIYPIAEAKNAKTDSVFHTSFEDASGTISQGAITGRRVFLGSFLIPGSYQGRYRLTYWKRLSGTASPWTLVETPQYSPSGITIAEPGYEIDEVRLFPEKSQVVTYTYLGDKILTATDANNMVTYFEYDQMGRLKTVRDHMKNILKAYDYHLVTDSQPPLSPQ